MHFTGKVVRHRRLYCFINIYHHIFMLINIIKTLFELLCMQLNTIGQFVSAM